MASDHVVRFSGLSVWLTVEIPGGLPIEVAIARAGRVAHVAAVRLELLETRHYPARHGREEQTVHTMRVRCELPADDITVDRAAALARGRIMTALARPVPEALRAALKADAEVGA